jgi:hypothetical protein
VIFKKDAKTGNSLCKQADCPLQKTRPGLPGFPIKNYCFVDKNTTKFVFFSKKINNLALKGEVCCSPEVIHSGFNTFLTALKLPRRKAGSWVLNPSARIK